MYAPIDVKKDTSCLFFHDAAARKEDIRLFSKQETVLAKAAAMLAAAF